MKNNNYIILIINAYDENNNEVFLDIYIYIYIQYRVIPIQY